jgi:hypothetical protein
MKEPAIPVTAEASTISPAGSMAAQGAFTTEDFAISKAGVNAMIFILTGMDVVHMLPTTTSAAK